MNQNDDKSYNCGQLNLLPNLQTIKRPSEALFCLLPDHIQGHKKRHIAIDNTQRIGFISIHYNQYRAKISTFFR